MNRLWIAAILLPCSCAQPAQSPQIQVNEVVRQCGLEAKAEFKWVGGNKVSMTRFDPDAGNDKFMCVAQGLEGRGLKLGFEGREQLNR